MEVYVTPASRIAKNAMAPISARLVNPVRNSVLLEMPVTLVTSMTASTALQMGHVANANTTFSASMEVKNVAASLI